MESYMLESLRKINVFFDVLSMPVLEPVGVIDMG